MADLAPETGKSFDAYEVIAVITPGVVVAIMLAAEWPAFKSMLGDKGLSLGDFGLFVLVAFVLGHLLQAAGNLLEMIAWIPGGLPTNWVRKEGSLITSSQRQALQAAVSEMEGHTVDISTLDRKQWRSITTRAYGRLKAAGRSARVDVCNRTYGLCRGLSAAMIIGLGWYLYAHHGAWTEITLIAITTGAALWRMRRAGVHYARALVLDFIDLGYDAKATTA